MAISKEAEVAIEALNMFSAGVEAKECKAFVSESTKDPTAYLLVVSLSKLAESPIFTIAIPCSNGDPYTKEELLNLLSDRPAVLLKQMLAHEDMLKASFQHEIDKSVEESKEVKQRLKKNGTVGQKIFLGTLYTPSIKILNSQQSYKHVVKILQAYISDRKRLFGTEDGALPS